MFAEGTASRPPPGRRRQFVAAGGTNMGRRTLALVTALVCFVALAPTTNAQPGGVQWSPDGFRLLVNKDVGAERWAITLNLSDGSLTGNVFFADARPPAFIFCEKTGHNHEPSLARLTIHYRCSAADG